MSIETTNRCTVVREEEGERCDFCQNGVPLYDKDKIVCVNMKRLLDGIPVVDFKYFDAKDEYYREYGMVINHCPICGRELHAEFEE